MAKKTLTLTGVKIEDIDLPKKEETPKIEKPKKEVSDYEYVPESKIKKVCIIFGISIISIFLIVLIVNMFWFNNSVSNDKFKSNDSTTNIINPPQVTVPVNNTILNNFTIQNNVYVSFSNDTLSNLSNQIVNDIMNKTKNCIQLNWTNCTI
jgi:hypothetical protein